MDEAVSAIVLLIGLAVGVDYSLFYLKREREERAAGRGEEAALQAAASTSGRSVLISGLTVMVAMAGMFLTGDKGFASFGLGDDAGRRHRDARVADRPAGAALPARRQRRPGPRPVRQPAAARRRRGADLGRDRRRRPARPVLSVVLAGGLLLAIAAAGAQRCTRLEPGVDTFPQSLAVDQDLQQAPDGVPGSRDPRERRPEGRRRARPRGAKRRSPASRSRRSPPARCTSRSSWT